MWIAALVLTLFIAAEVVSAVSDRGTRNRWFVRRHGFEFMEAHALMEVAGWHVRDTGLATFDGKTRRLLAVQYVGSWLVMLIVLLTCAALHAPWWAGATPVVLILAVATIPRRVWEAVKEWLDGDCAGAPPITVPGLDTVFGLVCLYFGVASVYQAIALDLAHHFGVALVYVSVGLAMMATAAVSIRRSRRQAPQEPAGPTEASALLLRSFSDDSLRIRMTDLEVGMLGVFFGHRSRFEECVAALAMPAGAMTALGRPGEGLPELGAIRVSAPEDNWKEIVEDTARRVRSIYVIAGRSGGLSWELGQLREWGLLEKTLVLIPPVKTDQLLGLLSHVFGLLGVSENGLEESNELFLALALTLTGVGLTNDGRPDFYVSDGGDWASYAATIVLFDGCQNGSIQPLPHGALAESMGYEIELKGREEGDQLPENQVDQDELACSFCGKKRLNVRGLIAGPSVYICDECVEICVDLLGKMGIDIGPAAASSQETAPLAGPGG